MSPDLRELLDTAAPRPEGALDVASIARRSRRMGTARIALAATVAVAVAVAVVSIDSPAGREELVGDPRPRPEPAPSEVEVHRREPLPSGPRYELASGEFGDDWDGERAGKRWRLLVWGDDASTCWQVADEDDRPRESVACSSHRRPKSARETALGGSMSFFTGSADPAEYLFIAGEAGPAVARLVFDGDRGPNVEIPLHAPPRSTGIPYRYYAVVLPRHDYARLVAQGADGGVLATHRMCGEGCMEDRADAEDAAVAAYEDEPVTLESAAAAFANAAAGRAGLLDQFATFWSYRRMGEGMVARFRTMDCSRGAPTGGYRCDPGYGSGAISVGVDGDTFYVAGARGPLTPGQRAALDEYTEPVAGDVREWRLVAQSFRRAGPRRWEVSFALVWTGNMNAPRDYGSVCRLTVFGPEGAVLHETRPLPFQVRDDERYRVAAPLTEVRSESRPNGLDVVCDAPRADLRG